MITLDDFTVTDPMVERFVTQHLGEAFGGAEQNVNSYTFPLGLTLTFNTFCDLMNCEKIHRIDMEFFGEHGVLTFVDNSSVITIPTKIKKWVYNTKPFKLKKKLARIEEDFND